MSLSTADDIVQSSATRHEVDGSHVTEEEAKAHEPIWAGEHTHRPIPTAPELAKDENPFAQFGRVLNGGTRSARTLMALGQISMKYKEMKEKCDAIEDPEERRKAEAPYHTEAGKQMLELFLENGGFQIKIGQKLATQVGTLPEELTTILSRCKDEVPSQPFADLEALVAEAFGVQDLSEVFSKVEEKALAAASICQVHRATLKDGRPVIIKIKHPNIDDTMAADLAMIPIADSTVGMVFPDVKLGFLAEIWKESVRQELDFRNEGHNRERLNAILGKAGQLANISLPRVVWRLCTKNVMVQELVRDACTVDDAEKIKAMGASPQAVASQLAHVFAEMAFIHGYVHGDLHGGNVLVTKSKPPKPDSPVAAVVNTMRSAGKAFRPSPAITLVLVVCLLLGVVVDLVRVLCPGLLVLCVKRGGLLAFLGLAALATYIHVHEDDEKFQARKDEFKLSAFSTFTSWASWLNGKVDVLLGAEQAHHLHIIDHGMHDHFPAKFRRQWCELWWALATGNEAALAAICASLGVEKDWDLVPFGVCMMPFALWKERRMPTVAELRAQHDGDKTTDANRAKNLAFVGQFPLEMHKAQKVNMQIRALYVTQHGRANRSAWIEFQRIMATYAAAGLEWHGDEPGNMDGVGGHEHLGPHGEDIPPTPSREWIDQALARARKRVAAEFDVH